MRSIRKLTLLGLLALMVSAAFASSAFATANAYNQATGATLNVGDSVIGTSTDSVLVGGFFGINQRVSCTHSEVIGTVVTNGSGTVAGKITSATWTGCTNGSGVSCDVKAYASNGVLLSSSNPWDPSSTGNMGGLLTTSTNSVSVGTGDTGYIEIKNAGAGTCLTNGFSALTCDFKGGVAGPLGSGHTLTNYVTGTWSNTAPQLTLNASVANSSPNNCSTTNATWSGHYTLKVGSTTTATDLVGLEP